MAEYASSVELRVILDGSGDLVGQAMAAKYALQDCRPVGDIMIVSRGDDHYAVKWNRASIRVYRQALSPTPALKEDH